MDGLGTLRPCRHKAPPGRLTAAIQETKGLLQRSGLEARKERALAIYYHGFAHFMLNDRAAAAREVAEMLSRYTDRKVFGTHAPLSASALLPPRR